MYRKTPNKIIETWAPVEIFVRGRASPKRSPRVEKKRVEKVSYKEKSVAKRPTNRKKVAKRPPK